MAGQYQTAIIVVIHDEKVIRTFKRLYNIRDGQTIEEAGQYRSVAWSSRLNGRRLARGALCALTHRPRKRGHLDCRPRHSRGPMDTRVLSCSTSLKRCCWCASNSPSQ